MRVGKKAAGEKEQFGAKKKTGTERKHGDLWPEDRSVAERDWLQLLVSEAESQSDATRQRVEQRNGSATAGKQVDTAWQRKDHQLVLVLFPLVISSHLFI